MDADPVAFISYSHADKTLARSLATALQERGIRVWIDEGELRVGDSIIERIATAIEKVDFFLALVSRASKDSNWCKKELALAVTGELGREGVRVLPLRVDGASMPAALGDVFYLDLEASTVDEVAQQVAAAIPQHQRQQEQRRERRGVGAGRVATDALLSSGESVPFEPIKILGIVEEGVGEPRSDGSRGSALYRIPLRLSRAPSREWADHFLETWDRPPRFTTMHRPGIASIRGDTAILDGTTMEELERYHIETLRHVLNKVNEDIAEHKAQESQAQEHEEVRRRQHERTVRDVSARLKFD